jgi:4-hydroxybenzoate polyprenyltransferase
LVHPFPSLLDGAVTVAVALIAGADPAVAGRLGLSMLALQASIGALNDLVDAPADAGRKPGKPIPAGLLTAATARAVVVVAAGVGLVVAGATGISTLMLALAVLVTGYGYDLVAKGTAWSWLPFALGVPLLPVFAWVGAAGELPAAFALLLPAALAAGAALAMANARADFERDVAAGAESVATRFGPQRIWRAQTMLLGMVAVVALASLGLARAPLAAMVAAALAVGVTTLGVGWAAGGDASPSRRERAWEIEAIGVAFLAAAWLAGVSVVA